MSIKKLLYCLIILVGLSACKETIPEMKTSLNDNFAMSIEDFTSQHDRWGWKIDWPEETPEYGDVCYVIYARDTAFLGYWPNNDPTTENWPRVTFQLPVYTGNTEIHSAENRAKFKELFKEGQRPSIPQKPLYEQR